MARVVRRVRFKGVSDTDPRQANLQALGFDPKKGEYMYSVGDMILTETQARQRGILKPEITGNPGKAVWDEGRIWSRNR